jgi:hypothetical protein
LAKDFDPIAWTNSGPEPDGPVLQWPKQDLPYPFGALFHYITVEPGEGLGNLEVPTGGLGYSGRLYLFIARDKFEDTARSC